MLSISNIGWSAGQDVLVYEAMKKYGFSGLEIAPTRIFTAAPYEKISEAGIWADAIRTDYGFCVPSMQSIWFGRQENIFGTAKERTILLEYTKKAIDFAEAIGCGNLVFGCPRNRNVPKGADVSQAIAFFKELGDYAALRHTVIGMEANPPIYHTNYINDTVSAFELITAVDSAGFKLNLDAGTMILNKEPVSGLQGRVKMINHVHISEPGLKPIERRVLHSELKKILEAEGYQGFISIEMGKTDNIAVLEAAMGYVKEIFG